jgi:hypothetical protein
MLITFALPGLSKQTLKPPSLTNTYTMRQFLILIGITFCFSIITNNVLAQDPREAEIRRMETLERESVIKQDSVALFDKICSPQMIVNTPANIVGTVEGTKAHFRSGDLNYLSFERTIEKISFSDNIAITMGGEIIKPQGKQINAGKTVSRRYTHVWLYKNNSWSLIARQATIFKIE